MSVEQPPLDKFQDKPRTRAYWEAKLERAQKELSATILSLCKELEQGGPKRERQHKRLRRRAKMLKRTKIPYYRDRIEATTPSRWEIILKGSFLD